MTKTGAAQYLHKLNTNTYKDEIIIQIQKIQELFRFFNFLTNITNIKINNCINVNLDFCEDIKKDLSELILLIDQYNVDYIDNRIEFILENNLDNHPNEFHILKNIINKNGQYLCNSFVKYFLQ
jgi:hypothetical protein